jgi:hypothetical protein
MAKKITAPHSYNPGKGRPQEYLAYLNAREMAYLRSINGNNMERGPRGLPSFPPEDAIGSSSNAPSKSPASSGVGRDSSRGIGQGAGGAAIGRGPSGGSPSGGGNLGGGGKGAPGGAPGSSPSSPGGLRGAGGNYGPGSGKPGTTSSPGGYKGPSSPMGGQGPSFSRDTEARQEAQVRDAIKAVKNSPAFRNDASSGGIRTLSVGPMGTPVNVGPRVAPTQNRTSGPNNYNNIVTGGGGVMAYGGPMPKAPTRVSPTATPPAQKEFYERIAPGATPSTSISSQFPSYKYSSPLTPGTSPEDMARRAAVMNQIEQEMRDMGLINKPAVTRTGSPIDAGGIPTGGRPPGKTRGFSLASPAEAAIPDPEEKILKVETFPESAGMSFTGNLPKKSKQFGDRLITNNGITKEATSEQINQMTPEDQKKLADSLQTPTYSPQKPTFNDFRIGKNPGSGLGGIDYLSGERTSYTPGDYDAYRNDGSVVDGTSPSQGEEPPPKNRSAAEAWKNTPYEVPGTPARQRGFVEKGFQEYFPSRIVRGVAKGLGYLEDRRIAGMTPDERIAEMDRRAQMDRSRFKGSDGREDGIGSGGKNEPPRIEQAEKEATKPKPKPKEDGRRPAIYYKWDLGVSVPSPTDSDYTLYLKYLQEKAASKAGMAR